MQLPGVELQVGGRVWVPRQGESLNHFLRGLRVWLGGKGSVLGTVKNVAAGVRLAKSRKNNNAQLSLNCRQ